MYIDLPKGFKVQACSSIVYSPSLDGVLSALLWFMGGGGGEGVFSWFRRDKGGEELGASRGTAFGGIAGMFTGLYGTGGLLSPFFFIAVSVRYRTERKGGREVGRSERESVSVTWNENTDDLYFVHTHSFDSVVNQ